jgi:hypothetical protein
MFGTRKGSCIPSSQQWHKLPNWDDLSLVKPT